MLFLYGHHFFFHRPKATARHIIMLLGAWPIGGNKRPPQSHAADRNGKCRFLLLCGSYGLFLIVGAAIFSVIEAPLLDRYQRDLVDAKDKFLQLNPCIKSKFNVLFFSPSHSRFQQTFNEAIIRNETQKKKKRTEIGTN